MPPLRCSRLRVDDLGDEARVAAREAGGDHAAIDVVGLDGADPGRPGAGVLRARLAATLRLRRGRSHVAAVALRVAGDEFVQLGGLFATERLDGIGIGEGLEEEIEVDVLRLAEGRARRRFFVGAEPQRTLPPERDELVGQRAQRVLCLCVAVADAQRAPAVGAHVGNAVGGAADVDRGCRRCRRCRFSRRPAPGPCRCAGHEDAREGNDGRAAAPRMSARSGCGSHGVPRWAWQARGAAERSAGCRAS
jgi:hypothetical protein